MMKLFLNFYKQRNFFIFNIIDKTQSKIRSFSTLKTTPEQPSPMREKVQLRLGEEEDPHRTLTELLYACIPIDRCTLKVSATTAITDMAEP